MFSEKQVQMACTDAHSLCSSIMVKFIKPMLVYVTFSPERPSDLPEAHSYDKDITFSIEEENDGFVLGVVCSKKISPWVTEAASRECKSQLISIVQELSDKTGRKIKPVNEESIKASGSSRTPPVVTIRGAIDCHAQAKVLWE